MTVSLTTGGPRDVGADVHIYATAYPAVVLYGSSMWA